MPTKTPSLKSVVDAVVSVVLVAAALTVIYRNVVSDGGRAAAELEVPSEPLSLDGAMTRGSTSAEAVMVVFADFQCPYCARFAREVQPEIDRRFVAPGRVAVAFRHLPLRIHPQAAHAALVAECAGQQGKFWEMHDRLFDQTSLTDDVLRAMPESLGLDRPAFDKCLHDRAIGDKVAASVAQAGALGVRATPAFFLGKRLPDGRVEVRRVLSGLRPVDEFFRELDATLGEGGPFWQRWVGRVAPLESGTPRSSRHAEGE